MRQIPALIFLILLALGLPASAQHCGCADEGNCPMSFPANSSSQVCYEITDAFNNNLASPTQGVCGVYVRFRHGRVGGLELTLTSPSGQSVLLVDASNACNTWTPIATWDILFVPCSEPCEPDTVNGCAYPCVFDGCPTNCPWQNATFSGLYHPFSGCLEDFTTGPANGQWCLEINNGAQFNGGAILDFEVILCDQTGILCCEADAGNLAFEPNVDACTGDTALLLTPSPMYGAVVPDPLEYDYTYAIFHGDTLIAYDTLTDLRTYGEGTYNVCGLSFLIADTASMPEPGDLGSPVSLFGDLTGPTPSFCGDIDTNCIRVRIFEPPPVTDTTSIICAGDTFFVGNKAYTASGSYADTIPSFGGCDSIIHLMLTVLEPDTTDLTETVCFGDSLFVANDTFSASGNYQVLFQNQYGCDSLVRIELTVLPELTTSLTDTICRGDTVWIGATPFTTTGTFTRTLTSFQNCDSTVTLNLTVVNVSVYINTHDSLDCQQLTLPLQAVAGASLGSVNYQWTTVGGHFTQAQNTAATTQVDAPGLYIITVTAANGCTAADTTQVIQDADLPNAVAASLSPDTLTCAVTSVQLDGSGSTGSPLLQFLWSNATGYPISNPTSPLPIVTLPGVYLLTVTNPANNCRDTASVVIAQNIAKPVAQAGLDSVLSCASQGINLDGSGSTPAGALSFQWSTANGNIVPPANIANPFIDHPGDYQLIVTNLVNGCRDTDLVVIAVDTLGPQAIINFSGNDTLTCANGSVTLDGSGSQNAQSAIFQWVGTGVNGQTTTSVSVTQPGDYALILSNPQNGCKDTAYVTVAIDTLSPQADAGPGGSLSCTNLSATLGGPGTSTGSIFTYQWTSSPGGAFGTDPTEPTVGVDSAGTYYLTVFNTLNGCQSMDSTVVLDNLNPPVADAGPDGTLDCNTSFFTLDGSASTGALSYEWTNSNGDLISFGATATVAYADTFVLTTTVAFCQSADTVVVFADTLTPVAIAGTDGSLDCLTGQATLDGNGSSAGANFSYQWTTPDGAFVSGENTLTPVVSEAGTYILLVTNGISLCAALDTVTVVLDTIACTPAVNAGADGLTNCVSMTYTIVANGSTGAPFEYAWKVISGMVLDSTDVFALVVTAGQYVLTVTNAIIGLSATDTVLVAADTLRPLADLDSLILPLGCLELATCYPLTTTGTSTGANFTYEWSSADGTFCTPVDVLDAEVQGEGIYELIVTNETNGCTAADAVLVQLLDFLPNAVIAGDVQMLCGDTFAYPDGSASSTGGNYTYQWLSNTGTILSGGTSMTPQVAPNNLQDTFTLVVTNFVNQCQDTASVVVYAPSGCFPACIIAPHDNLDCNTDTVYLDASASTTGPDVTYQWTALSGHLCGGETTPIACVDAAGIYLLTVTRTYPNGAEFSTECSAQVLDFGQPPIAEAGPPVNITCSDPKVTLDGNASSAGAGIVYSWTTTDGNIFSGPTTRTPIVDAIGTYTLLVTNNNTGCTATDFTTVGMDTLHPVANAGPDLQLTCASNNAILNGGASTSGMNFLWSSMDGVICAGQTSPVAFACAPGTYILLVRHPVNGCTDTDTVVVSPGNDLPQANAGPDLYFTCKDTVFTLNASASGVGALAYEWEALDGGCIAGPNDVLQITVACTGTYRLTVRNLVNGCQRIDEMQVIADTLPPVADAGSTQEINCQNLVAALDGSGSMPAGQLDFWWTTTGNGNILSGADSANPTVDSAGLYTLVVMDQQTGCRDTATVTISRDASIPVANAGADTTLTCVRTSLKLNGAGSSSGAGIQYQWTTPDGTIIADPATLFPTISTAGTYLLRVEDTNSLCVVFDSTTVTLDVVEPLAVIDPAPLTVNCYAPQVTIIGSQSLPADTLNWLWTTGNGHIFNAPNAPNVVVDSGGVYLLTVTNSRNGCTATASVTVDEDFSKPSVAINPPPPLDCDHASVSLEVFPPTSAPIYAYHWDGPQPISDADSTIATASKTGLYTIVITNLENGCTNQGQTAVTENYQLPVAVANSLGKLDCDNLVAAVSGEGSTGTGVSYLWTTNTAGQIAAPAALQTDVDAPGWYYLTVRRLDNGCTATDSTQVIASSLPIDSARLRLDHPGCDDLEGYIYIDSVFGGTSPYYYSLNSDVFITYPQFSYLDAGAYAIAIEDVNGCRWETTVYLLTPGEVLVELGEDRYIKQGESVELEAQTNLELSELDTLIWQGIPGDPECPGCPTQVVSPSETTTYRVMVLDTGGCMASDKITIWVDEQAPFFVPTAFSPNGDGTNDRLIFYAGDEVTTVLAFRIFDRWGNLVFFEKGFHPNDPRFGWDGSFEGQMMNPAVFVWKAEVVMANGERAEFYGDVSLAR
jgi:gliding motility-associated-like protein